MSCHKYCRSSDIHQKPPIALSLHQASKDWWEQVHHNGTRLQNTTRTQCIGFVLNKAECWAVLYFIISSSRTFLSVYNLHLMLTTKAHHQSACSIVNDYCEFGDIWRMSCCRSFLWTHMAMASPTSVLSPWLRWWRWYNLLFQAYIWVLLTLWAQTCAILTWPVTIGLNRSFPSSIN